MGAGLSECAREQNAGGSDQMESGNRTKHAHRTIYAGLEQRFGATGGFLPRSTARWRSGSFKGCRGKPVSSDQTGVIMPPYRIRDVRDYYWGLTALGPESIRRERLPVSGERSQASRPSRITADLDAPPNIFTAFEQQLGLKLQPTRGSCRCDGDRQDREAVAKLIGVATEDRRRAFPFCRRTPYQNRRTRD